MTQPTYQLEPNFTRKIITPSGKILIETCTSPYCTSQQHEVNIWSLWLENESLSACGIFNRRSGEHAGGLMPSWWSPPQNIKPIPLINVLTNSEQRRRDKKHFW